MNAPRIGILAIGTELTTGQIVNRNASWISKKLHVRGTTTDIHLTVPDDRKMILDAFDYMRPRCDLIFITGGLGPTSDDFTREVLAEWVKKPLEWHEESWTHIQERLSSRGIPAKEIQKQQCYYPRGSVILPNQLGTAHGFLVETQDPHHFAICLPGPPKEIESVWNDHVSEWIEKNFPQTDPWITRSWEILGQPESEIAQRIQSHLQGCPYELAYRVHLPFVEFKLSYFKSSEDSQWIQKVNKALEGLPVRFDQPEPANEFVQTLLTNRGKEKFDLTFHDSLSEGYLFNKLAAHVAEISKAYNLAYLSNDGDASSNTNPGIFFSLKKVPSLPGSKGGRAEAKMGFNGVSHVLIFDSPYASDLLRDREKHYFVERAFMEWTAILKK